MLNHRVIPAIILLIAMALVMSCHGSSGGSEATTDTVAIATIHLSDSVSFVKSNGERLKINATADIKYPAAGDSLQRLFAHYVLDGGDTLTLRDAMQQCVSNSMHQYDFMPADADDEEDEAAANADATIAYQYATSTQVLPVFNKNGMVTFVRVDVVKKNGVVTSVTHRYYTLDARRQCYVDTDQLFAEESMSEVCQLLRAKLLSQNNATSNEQMNDLGYFNVENITVTSNFYPDGTGGITWRYLPNELAVEAIGEPAITLSISDLEPYASEGSVLGRLN